MSDSREAHGDEPAWRPSRMIVGMCLAVGVLAWVYLWPQYLGFLRPKPGQSPDLYQDWASARNYRNGLPVYSPHAVTMPMYLGREQLDWERDIAYNAHPPTSVLLALPVTGLEISDAMFAWNMATIVALLGTLTIIAAALPELKALFAPVALLLPLCLPVYGNLQQGQLTLFLLLLVTSAWALERSGRSLGAGAMIGAAATIKCFPAYLIVYFVARRSWRGLAGAAAAFLVLTIVTAAVLGTQAYADYLHVVLPGLQRFRSYAFNHSFFGLWNKLFDPASERGAIRPLWYCPPLARYGALTCDLIVTVIVMVASWRARTIPARDLAFSMAVTAMLLVSPITWDYSLALLLLPLAVATCAAMTSRSHWATLALVPMLVVFGVPQSALLAFVLPGMVMKDMSPAFVMGIPTMDCYLIISLFGLLAALSAGWLGRVPAIEAAWRDPAPVPTMDARPSEGKRATESSREHRGDRAAVGAVLRGDVRAGSHC